MANPQGKGLRTWVDLPSKRQRRMILSMRFSLQTTLGYVTLWALLLALLAVRSELTILPAGALGVIVIYLPIVYACNRLIKREPLRLAVVAVSGGVVSVVVILGMAFALAFTRP